MDFPAAALATPFVFVFGASIGSFLNVVAYRLPAGLSLLVPPSHCPRCFHRLSQAENIPILGWFRLRGRCRWCHSPISWRYPGIEAATALLFCFTFWQFGFTLTTLGYWTLLSWLLALSIVDLDTLTLPNSLTQSGLVVGLGFQLLRGWQEGQAAATLMLAIASATLGIWLLELIRWLGTLALGQPAMGGGDPKLAALIGAWLGWKSLLVAGFLACGLGAFIGGTGMALGWLSRRQPIPFGPFLALGAALAAFWGDWLLSAYQSLFFPLTPSTLPLASFYL